MSEAGSALRETARMIVLQRYKAFVEHMQEQHPGFGEMSVYIGRETLEEETEQIYRQLLRKRARRKKKA